MADSEAVVEWGNVQSELAYELTSRALSQEGAVSVFPLLALSVSAIGYGFAAFREVSVAAQQANERAKTLLAQAEQRMQKR